MNPITAFDLDGFFDPVSDYFSGYTSANAAQRFAVENLALQQKYNEKNMALQQGYNETNMGLQQGYNEKNMALTDQYQRDLMSDSPSLQVAALRRAGLNPLLAVNNGITSAGTAVHASNPSSSSPQSSSPMPSGPSVNPQLGSLLQGISTVAGLGNTVSDMILKQAQTKASEASSAESAARTIKTLREADSIDPELEKDLKRYPGKLGREALSLRNGVTQPIFNIINSAWSATKDWVKDDIKATGDNLRDFGSSAKKLILSAPSDKHIRY